VRSYGGRSLGTIIGALFFIAIFIGALAVLFSTIGWYSSYYEELHERSVRDWERSRESFEILHGEVDGAGELKLLVQNTGPLTVRLTQLWVVASGGHRCIPIDVALEPGERTLLVEDVGAADVREVKLVSSRGNVAHAAIPYERLVRVYAICPAYTVRGAEAFTLIVVIQQPASRIEVAGVKLKFIDHDSGDDISHLFTLVDNSSLRKLPLTIGANEALTLGLKYRYVGPSEHWVLGEGRGPYRQLSQYYC